MSRVRIVALSACSLAVMLLMSTAAKADDMQDSQPTITATVTLPPKNSGGGDHPSPNTPPHTSPPSVCSASPAPAGPAIADRYNTLHHHNATGLGVIEILYYSEQNSLHRYNVDSNRFERLVRVSCTDPS